ncbi:RdRp [Culex mononega-like virus 2]|uniref:Replicase n=1 Tax=Culex mononega-like virus 2 TaxID=2010272 RepID=A0A1Z2RT94_9MONO|nr:RdRp [Culex mononega-like virus 2]
MYYDELEREAVEEDDDEECCGKAKQKKKPPRTQCVAGHLAAPIYNTDCEFLIETVRERKLQKSASIRRGRLCTRHYRLSRRLEEAESLVSIYEQADPISFIQTWVMNTVKKNVDHDFEICLNALLNLDLQKRTTMDPYIRGGLITEEEIRAANKRQITRVTEGVRALKGEYIAMRRAEYIKDKVCFKEIVEGDVINYCGVSIERDVGWFNRGTEKIIFPTNLFLCSLDKMQSMFGLKMYWVACDAEEKYEGQSILSEGSRIAVLLEGLRSVMGQDYFDFVGGWEALVVGKVVANSDDSGCTDLYECQKKEMGDLLAKYGKPRDLLEKLVPSTEIQNEVLLYLELTGMAKITGYPTLRAEKLLDQIRKYGTDPKREIRQEVLDDVMGVVRREICLNYRKIHHTYPVIAEMPEELSFLERNTPCPKNQMKNYAQWSKVRFGKSLTFDYFFDESDLTKDSAIAVPRSKWHEMYDPCAFRHLYGKDPPPRSGDGGSTCRRVIDAYLVSEPDKVRKLIEQREAGKFNPDDHICVECGKECELKIDSGRAFTKQTADQRLIQTCMEANIANNIFPLVPQQSMVDGEIRNTKRIMSQVKDLLGPSEFLSIDFQKWCLNWRHASVVGIGEMYDELFGLKRLYRDSHLQFIGCDVFCNNRLTPPNYDAGGRPIPGDYYMNDFLGGMEGMHQKKWTHFCEAILILCLERSGIKGEIMGQGDNQVILLQYPKEAVNIADLRANFLNNLELTLRNVGHKLKEKETWFSKHLHEYSKQRIYKGVAVSSGTKKASKIIPDINDGLFSLPSMGATLNTITEGIARASYTPDAAYFVNQFMYANLLCRYEVPFSKKDHTLSNNRRQELVRWCLQCPADFGGMPMSTYYTHSVRGHNDKITLWLHLAMVAKKYDPSLFDGMIRMWQLYPRSEVRGPLDRTRLYEDVYSLRVKSLPSAESKIRTLTLDFLKSDEVTNPMIKMLHEGDKAKPYEDVIIAVDQMRPVYPQLGHELLRNSNAGILRALQSKLTGTKTIENITRQRTGVSLVDLIDQKNKELIIALQLKINGKVNIPENESFFKKYDCPSSGAEHLRDESWKVPLVGVTQAVFTHQVTISSKDQAVEEGRTVGVEVRVSGELYDNPTRCFKVYGPLKPYVGGSTQVKLKKSSIDMIDKTSYTRAFQKLGILRSWMEMMRVPGLVLLIDQLMEEKKDLFRELPEGVTYDELLSTVTSGCIFHRLQSAVDHDTAIVNCLPCITGHFQHSSNPLAAMSAGGKDFSIYFQLLYVSNVVMLAQIGKEKQRHSQFYMMTFDCKTCTVELSNITIEAPLQTCAGTEALHKAAPQIVPGTVLQDIRSIMSFQVGRVLAKNVDDNYTMAHVNTSTHSSEDPRKDTVSLNDLRQLDIKIVLTVMLTHSKRGRSMYESAESILSCHTEDRSFAFFAEKVLEAGMRGELFKILDIDIGEHSAVTTSMRMSGFIAGTGGKFLRRDKKYTVATSLMCEFRSDSDAGQSEVVRFCAKILHDTGKISASCVASVNRQLSHYRNYRLAKEVMGIEYIKVPLAQDEVITVWRSSDRESVNVYPSRTKVHITGNSSRYPVEEAGLYHTTRAASAEAIRTLFSESCTFQQLCYIARPLGFISTAGNKFVEAIIAIDMFNELQDLAIGSAGEDPYHIVSVAEGSGGTLSLLMKLFPGTKGMYNTLMKPSISCREVVGDNLPPAMYDAGIPEQDFCELDLLATGETDITTDHFFAKLKKSLRNKKVLVFTMDAESPTHGNNLEFLPILEAAIDGKPRIMLIKLFFLFNFEPYLTDIMNHYPDYEWLLFKPISSNPTGPEVYLVIKHRSLSSSSFKNMKTIWGRAKQYIGRSMNISYTDVKCHFEMATRISKLLGSLSPGKSMFMTNRFKRLFPEIGCSLYCRRFFDNICDEFDLLHNYEVGSPLLYTVLRNKGGTGMMEKLVRDIVFLHMYHAGKKNFLEIILDLMHVNVGDDLWKFRREPDQPFITRSVAFKSSFFSGWEDSKTYLREIPWVTPCDCSVEISVFPKTGTSLAMVIGDQLVRNVLITHNDLAGIRVNHDESLRVMSDPNRYAQKLALPRSRRR